MEFEMSEKGNGRIPLMSDEAKDSDNECSKLLSNNSTTPQRTPGRTPQSQHYRTQNITTSNNFPRFKFPAAAPRKHQTKAILKGGKGKESLGIVNVLAAQTLKIASINGLGELDKLENDLEEEINYENKSNAKTVIGRLRREGHHHLHSKVVLFLVVILNIIDCLLVMGELTLDFHHVSHLLTTKKAMVDSFADELQDKYSPHLDDLVKDERYILLQSILDSNIVWPQDIIRSAADNVTLAASQCQSYISSAAQWTNQSYEDFVQNLPDVDWSSSQPISGCFQPLVGVVGSSFSSSASSNGYDDNSGENNDEEEEYRLTSFDKPNEKLIVVAHKLHYISVAILSVLVVLLLLKIICAGKRFLRSKMAVFDGIVVVISFVLDIVFIKGIHIFTTDDFVIILTFLLPWRIIRVLNSLIAAVLDKQRLNLKIIYTQKKKITRNLTEVNNKVEVMQRQIQILQGLCSSRGITDGDVRKILGTDSSKPDKHEKSDSKKHHSSGHGLASMMALGKLAFQAADALAPMPDIKGRSTPTSPVATPLFGKHPLQTSTSTSTSGTDTTTTTSTQPHSGTNTNTTTNTSTTSNGVIAHHHAPLENGSVPKDTTSSSNDNNAVNAENNVIGGGGSGDTVTSSSSANPNPNANNNNNNTPTTNNKFQQQQNTHSAPGGKSTTTVTPDNNLLPKVKADEDYSVVSDTLDVPEVSESASLDLESAATISMDLRDDDISASIDDVNVHFEMENDDACADNRVNDSNATSRL